VERLDDERLGDDRYVDLAGVDLRVRAELMLDRDVEEYRLIEEEEESLVDIVWVEALYFLLGEDLVRVVDLLGVG
jgi:hypothetical protein